MFRLAWKRRSTSVKEQLEKLTTMKRGESIQKWLKRADIEVPKILAERDERETNGP